VVWALRLEMVTRAFAPQPPQRLPVVELVSPALSSNPNMAAQSGFLTVDRSRTAPHGFDVTIKNQAAKLKTDFQYLGKPTLYRFLLPHSEAGYLLELLAREHVHAATLFPGFDGVAKHLTERRYWARRNMNPLDPDAHFSGVLIASEKKPA